jgi:hypothetical protein
MAVVGDRLEERDFRFWKWEPQYHRSPPRPAESAWAARWVWDFLPLHAVGGWWLRGGSERAPGAANVLVEHILDTGIEKWFASANHGEPDALTFAPEADTVWRARR